MSDPLYCQCTLRKGAGMLINWLPKEFAILNKSVRLKDEQGGWDYGWQIIEVGNILLDHETVLSNSQDYKHTREASDI